MSKLDELTMAYNRQTTKIKMHMSFNEAPRFHSEFYRDLVRTQNLLKAKIKFMIFGGLGL